jgi:hypothetical protein
MGDGAMTLSLNTIFSRKTARRTRLSCFSDQSKLQFSFGTAHKGAIKDDHPRDLRHMDYGPAPESDAEVRAWIADKGPAFGPFHRRPLHRAGRDLRDEEPRHRRGAGRGHAGQRPTMWTPPSPPRAPSRNGRSCSGHERAYLYALARLLQKHARLFAVLERSTTASRSARRATSTCRWRSGISTTTQAWRNFLQKNSPDRVPSASAARSSRGTSRS